MDNNLKTFMTVEELLDDWKQKHAKEGRIRFVYDGCVDDVIYQMPYPKIMLLLRECYFDENDKENKKKPWANFIEHDEINKIWTYRLNENLNGDALWFMWRKVDKLLKPIIDKMRHSSCNAPLHCVSIVNLKKSKDNSSAEPSNSRPYSNLDKIKEYAVNDKEYLKRQIEILNPDIIICGGTYAVAYEENLLGTRKEPLVLSESMRGLRAIYQHSIEFNGEKKNLWVVDMWHPSSSISPGKVGSVIAKTLISEDCTLKDR